MPFTKSELEKTAFDVRREIAALVSGKTKVDVLFGTHPFGVLSSRRQAIAIWHGTRIEERLAEWINKTSTWSAQKRVEFDFDGLNHTIDNIVWHSDLKLVLGVQPKRQWNNQDGTSRRDISFKSVIYNQPRNRAKITARFGLSTDPFRFFVFDVYGTGAKGNKYHSVVSGSEIVPIFGEMLFNYVQWERVLISNTVFSQLNLEGVDNSLQEQMLERVLNSYECELPTVSSILKHIDS